TTAQHSLHNSLTTHSLLINTHTTHSLHTHYTHTTHTLHTHYTLTTDQHTHYTLTTHTHHSLHTHYTHTTHSLLSSVRSQGSQICTLPCNTRFSKLTEASKKDHV